MPYLEEARVSLLSNVNNGGTAISSASGEHEKVVYPSQGANLMELSIMGHLSSGLWGLVPSFLRRTPHESTMKKLHPTAYLDGLRGTAAFIVFIHHLILDWYPVLSSGYGSGNVKDTSYVLQLPILRLLYSGRGMVAVFFVISGSVLSYKSLRLMRAGHYSTLLETLASSTFRRNMRLCLPLVVSTFISMLFCRLDWYQKDPLGRNTLPPRLPDFYSQVRHWWACALVLVNPFVNVDGVSLYSPPYDGHLWTIPIELHGSFVIFLTLICASKLRSFLRLFFLAALTWYAMWVCAHWELFLFISGILLCEIQLIRQSRFEATQTLPTTTTTSKSTPNPSEPDFPHTESPEGRKPQRTIIVQALMLAIFALSLFILSFPDENAGTSPGYIRLINMTPEGFPAGPQRFWLAIASFTVVLSINFSPMLQHIFNLSFPQYLGKISYSLYIVHGPILYTLGMYMLHPAVRGLQEAVKTGSPDETNINYLISFVLAAVVNSAACFWAADLFWRMVDAKSVTFAAWVASKCWVKEG